MFPRLAIRSLVVLSLAVVALASIALAPLALAQGAGPAAITVNVPALMPEGIEWDAQGGRFLLSSLSKGAITAVKDDGSTTMWPKAPEAISLIGLEVDTKLNRVLAAASDSKVTTDPSAKGSAGLVIYDLGTGQVQRFVDLSGLAPEGRHFANDIAVDAQGNAYVTDSFTPVIYKVTPDGTASILVRNKLLGHEVVGANGIVFHPDGYLIVGVMGNGTLWKIPLDQPDAITQVGIGQPINADGMVWLPDGNLAVVGGLGQKLIFRLSSKDGWNTASIDSAADVPDGATTLAVRGADLYVLFGNLGQMPPPESYRIDRVTFPAAASPTAASLAAPVATVTTSP
jgi:sugar lactone lactonase YvrE